MVHVTLVIHAEFDEPVWESTHRFFEDVLDHLMEIEEREPLLSDADLSVNLREGHVEVGVAVAMEDMADAFKTGSTAITKALDAARTEMGSIEVANDVEYTVRPGRVLAGI